MAASDLDELRLLRRARDRMDREYAAAARRPGARPHGVDVDRALQPPLPRGYGETPYSYLMTRRIERAKALLRRGDIERDGCLLRGRLHEPRLASPRGSPRSSARRRARTAPATTTSCGRRPPAQAMVLTRPRRGGPRGRESRFEKHLAAAPA